MKCQTCQTYLNEESQQCQSCGDRTPKGIEIAELKAFDALLVKLRDTTENGDFAVDFEYAESCNAALERLVDLIDDLRYGVVVQQMELEIE